jgi:secondary thiamine-phosphate synthase enzyme
MSHLTVATERSIQAIDLTDRLTDRRWPDGVLLLSVPHTTAALIIGEADPEMLQDYERVARDWFAPWEPFKHHKNDNPNAAAHLVSSLAGTQLVLRVTDGALVLGTYQRIVLLELDGPKARRVDMVSLPTQSLEE